MIFYIMQETAPQAYEKYREFVLDILTENGTLEKTIQDYKNKIEQTRKENGLTKEQLPDLTDEEIMDEIAADYTTQFLKDTQLFQDFISKSKEHKKLGQRMIDAFKSVLAKIRKNISRSKLGDSSRSDLAPAEKALYLWEQAYQSGQDIVEISPAQKSTGDGKVKKSIIATGENFNGKNMELQEWEIQTALYDSLDHADNGGDNLIRVG